jgi:chemotaxis signal transduction protein
METVQESFTRAAETQPERVLVFSVDDGLFGFHLDWVEAVLQRTAEVHRVRTERAGAWHRFLLHRDEPAPILDLRDALDLGQLGQTSRDGYVVIRSAGRLLALAIDACVGVQDLDLSGRPPVPSSVTRDGGIPVAHLVGLDGQMLAVLDPNRILDGRTREALEPVWAKARAYGERHAQSEALWREICAAASADNLRTYARLCSRNGRTKTAAAVRTVLKHMEDLAGSRNGMSASGGRPVDRLAREVVRLASLGETGQLYIEGDGGRDLGAVFFSAGRVIDARHEADWGRVALRRLLAADEGSTRFAHRDLGEHPVRLSDSAAAVLIDSLQAVAQETRRRRR